MSTGTKPQVLLPAYDAQDLRRRMPVCFTIGELYALAARLQVPQTPGWSNNPQEASRDIVKHFERSGALAFLVEALREAKPLVEWPEPLPLPVPPAPPPAAAAAPPAAAPVVAFVPSPPGSSPGAPASAPAAGGPTILGVPAEQALESVDAPNRLSDRPTPVTDVPAAVLHAAAQGTDTPPPQRLPAASGFAPSVMPKPGELPATPPAAAAPPAAFSGPDAPTVPSSKTPFGAPAAPPSSPTATPSSPAAPPPARVAPTQAGDVLQDPMRPPSSARSPGAWPGTVRPASDAKKMPDPRILMGVGAAILLALIGVAFLAGRASSGPTSASGATSGTSGPSLPADQVAIAQTAADALGTSLLRVAKACQIDPATLRGRSLFEVAYRRCGPPLPQPSQPSQPSARNTYDPDPAQNDPSPQDDPEPQPTGGKKPSRPASSKPQKVDSPAPTPGGGSGAGCLSGCAKNHSACTAHCGAEPQQGSQYDAYQSCLGGCLKALSQCKMGCN